MQTKQILVVEDHAPLRAAIQMLLEREGYRVTTAADGNDGILAMTAVLPDLIVADIGMPGMNGYEFYESVRAKPAWNTIPFVFLTARAEREDILKGKSLGAEEYLTKPLDPEELLVVVRARLARSESIRVNMEAELDVLKSHIVAALSHELRTPLTWIMAYTELVVQYVRDLPPEQLQEFLSHVMEGGERITRLADDLLLLIRLDEGQLAQNFQQVAEVRNDLRAILDDAVLPYEKRCSERDLTLRLEVDEHLPAVRINEEIFIDALGRLVDNAIKFTREPGKAVTVQARAVEEGVEIRVIDEGTGIASEEVPHLFQRFRQIDRDKVEQQGVGLGLAIAQGLARLHGGEIEAESVLGVGSTFTMRLPAAGS